MLWWRFLGGIVLVALTLATGWWWNRWQFQRSHHRAVEALHREDYELAQANLAECLRYRPHDSQICFELGRAFRRADQFVEAKQFLKQAADLGYDPDRIILETSLLEVQQSGWRNKIAFLLARVDADDPDAARIHEVLARAFYAENLLESGLTQTDYWLEHEPESPTAWEIHGLLYERRGLADKALHAFEMALRYDPERFKAQLGAGNMAYARYQMDSALHHFGVAVNLRPRDWEARIGYARVLADNHRFEEAKEQVAAALILEPNNYQVLGTAGRVALLSGQLIEAEKYFKEATATVGDAKILMDYRLCLARMNRLEEARKLDARITSIETDLERIAELRSKMRDPNDPVPRVEAGRLLIKHGLYNEGRSWLQEALKVAPNYPPAHAVLTELYEKLNRPEQAAYHRQRSGEKKK